MAPPLDRYITSWYAKHEWDGSACEVAMAGTLLSKRKSRTVEPLCRGLNSACVRKALMCVYDLLMSLRSMERFWLWFQRVHDLLDAYMSTLRYDRHLKPLNLVVITDGLATDYVPGKCLLTAARFSSVPVARPC